MTYPINEPGHFVAVRREGFHHIVKCVCNWQAPGAYYHPERAQMAGERHIKEQGQ